MKIDLKNYFSSSEMQKKMGGLILKPSWKKRLWTNFSFFLIEDFFVVVDVIIIIVIINKQSFQRLSY